MDVCDERAFPLHKHVFIWKIHRGTFVLFHRIHDQSGDVSKRFLHFQIARVFRRAVSILMG